MMIDKIREQNSFGIDTSIWYDIDGRMFSVYSEAIQYLLIKNTINAFCILFIIFMIELFIRDFVRKKRDYKLIKIIIKYIIILIVLVILMTVVSAGLIEESIVS